MIVAIDGPSGAGKSTVAKAVARKLGFSCLDTGAMYRAIAWKALEEGIDLADAAALGELARTCEIAFEHEGNDPIPRRVFIDGADVTSVIRTAEDRPRRSLLFLPRLRYVRRSLRNSSASVRAVTTWSKGAISAPRYFPMRRARCS